MRDPLFQIVPGYQAAVEREGLVRSAAFLPVTETVNGVECLPLTPLHFATLDAIKSPFVKGGIPNQADVAIFLWAVSPRYSQTNRWAFYWTVRSFRGLDYADSLKAIYAYLAEAFADAPGVKGEVSVSYYSASASIVDLIASEYHWPERDIIRLPFKRLFQYFRCIQTRHVEKPIFFNASDLVLSDWQEKETEKSRLSAATN